MPSSLNRADSKLTHSGRTLVANSDPQEGPNFVSHEVNPEEYYNQTTEVRLVSRVTHPTDSQPPNNNHNRRLAIGRRRLPDPPTISASSQRGAAGITVPATYHPRSPTAYETSYPKDIHSSHLNWPSNSETPARQFAETDFQRGSTHDYPDNWESTFPFDGTSNSSAQSSPQKTKVPSPWSTLSAATTSMTSFPSRIFRTDTPKLDLEIPSHSLSIDTGPLRGSSQISNFVHATGPSSFDLGSTTARQFTLFQSNVHRLQADPAEAISMRFDQNQGLLRPDPRQRAIRNPLSTFHLKDGLVASGTLEELVQYLITGYGQRGHDRYRDTFLMACSELPTTPEDLFQILSRRLTQEEYEGYTTDDGFGNQYPIFLIIIQWLQSNYFPPNEELLHRIKVWCEDTIPLYPRLESIARKTSQEIDAKLVRPTVSNPPNSREPILKSSDVTPRDLVIALSLLEGDNYKALRRIDYLLHTTSDRIKRCRQTYEKIRLWVIGSILHHDSISSRSEMMNFFTETALKCYSARNFSSASAIFTALRSSTIENLKATTKTAEKALSKKTKAKLPALYELIDLKSNHQGYYAAIQKAATAAEKAICIPWLPVHLMELDKVLRQPLTVEIDGQHPVNFTRYNMFVDLIQNTLYYSAPDLEDKRHGGQLAYLLRQLGGIELSGNLDHQLAEDGRVLGTQESSRNAILNHNIRRLGF